VTKFIIVRLGCSTNPPLKLMKKINLKTLRNENPSTWQVGLVGFQHQRTIDNLITDTGSLTLMPMPAPTHNIGGVIEQMLVLSCSFRFDLIHKPLLRWSSAAQ